MRSSHLIHKKLANSTRVSERGPKVQNLTLLKGSEIRRPNLVKKKKLHQRKIEPLPIATNVASFLKKSFFLLVIAGNGFHFDVILINQSPKNEHFHAFLHQDFLYSFNAPIPMSCPIAINQLLPAFFFRPLLK